MSSKKIAGLAVVAGLSFSLMFVSCKKSEKDKPETAEEQTVPDESGQSGTDSRDAQSENDAVVNEINEVFSNNPKTSGKPLGDGQTAAKGNLCGLTVDSLFVSTGVIKLNYDGVTTCNNRTRSGAVKLTLLNYANGVRWKDLGATIKIEYLNFKIERASDKKSMTFNGVQMLKNESGGNWLTLFLLQQPLITSITGTNLSVTFQDNKTAVYNINRKVTYTYTTNVLSAKAEGIGSANNLNDLENYGTTRDGDAFTSQVTTPVIWNSTCGGGAPIQGAVNIKVASKAFDLKFTYGVNASGSPVTVGPNQCPFGWKLEWTVNSVSNSKVIGYN